MNGAPVLGFGVIFVVESKCTLRTWFTSIAYLPLVIFTLLSDTLATGASGSPQITPQYEPLNALDEYDGRLESHVAVRLLMVMFFQYGVVEEIACGGSCGLVLGIVPSR